MHYEHVGLSSEFISWHLSSTAAVALQCHCCWISENLLWIVAQLQIAIRLLVCLVETICDCVDWFQILKIKDVSVVWLNFTFGIHCTDLLPVLCVAHCNMREVGSAANDSACPDYGIVDSVWKTVIIVVFG